MTDGNAPTPPVNKALGTVIVSIGQVTQVATLALGLLGIYKQARDKWKAEHPDDPTAGPFLTDLELIDALDASADDVVAKANRLLEKYGIPPA